MKSILSRYTNYNLRANEQLLNVVERDVSDEMLDRNIVSSFSSLRKTIYHLWDAEVIWMKRLKGESITDWPSKSFNGTFLQAKELIKQIDKSFIEFTESLSEEKLMEVMNYNSVDGKPYSNPIWESLHHCMNHCTYHRGQIVTMLRQLGVSDIPSTDFIMFCRQ